MLCGCGSMPTRTDESDRASNGSMVFESEVYDFGIAGQQEEIKHDFVFKNTGDGLLQIKNLRPSCGCVAALLSGENIPSGETGIIQVTFKTNKYEGKQKKFIYVETNDPKEPKIELVVQGNIKSDIAVDPQGIHFGDVIKGETVSKKVKVFDMSNEGLQLKRIQINEKLFAIKTETFKGEHNRGFELEITLKPDIPAGPLKETITLHTNLKRRPRIDIPVLGNILGDIKVDPKFQKGEQQ